MGTAKVASTFNLNIKAISKHIANCLSLMACLQLLLFASSKHLPLISPPMSDSANIAKTTKWKRKYNHAHDIQKWWDKNTQKIHNLVM